MAKSFDVTIKNLNQRNNHNPKKYQSPGAIPAKPRIYVDIEGEEFNELHTRIGKQDETKEEKAETRRGYNAQRKIMRRAIELAFLQMGFRPEEAKQAAKDSKWSWYAGCSSCPCSSGFIYQGDLLTTYTPSKPYTPATNSAYSSPKIASRDLWIDADIYEVVS